jgi:hypothetical protein
LHFPTPEESEEFFSPPLPYVLPAVFDRLTGMRLNLFWAGKFGQLVNVLLSCGLTWYLLKICRLIDSRPALRIGALGFLGLLPVYYKTFAMVRGEPYVAFFSVVTVYYVLLIFVRKQFSWKNALLLSTAMAACALSRQWGIFLFPAVGLFAAIQWLRYSENRGAIAKATCTALGLGSVVGSSFYLYLRHEYGSTTSFNRKPMPSFCLSNQPADFYFSLGNGRLFTRPVNHAFPNQFLPIFYTETWGDYWGVFVFYGQSRGERGFIPGACVVDILADKKVAGWFSPERESLPKPEERYVARRVESPEDEVTPAWLDTNLSWARNYLGRVNAVSLFPTALAVVAMAWSAAFMFRRTEAGSIKRRRAESLWFLCLAILVTLGGYAWFLLMYPSIGKGDTIKATYMLSLFPMAAVLVGMFMADVRRRAKKTYWIVGLLLILVVIHNLPAMVSQYTMTRYYAACTAEQLPK